MKENVLIVSMYAETIIAKKNIAEDIKACQLKENDQALINSTSGGFFYSLGKFVISEGECLAQDMISNSILEEGHDSNEKSEV